MRLRRTIYSLFILAILCNDGMALDRMDLVCTAIKERKLLGITYSDGTPRLLEPHIYGLGNHGQVLLSAYQIGGPRVSGDMHGWRSFSDEKIVKVRISAVGFSGPRPDYNPDFTQFSESFCRL